MLMCPGCALDVPSAGRDAAPPAHADLEAGHDALCGIYRLAILGG
jgi:hypothetical protein